MRTGPPSSRGSARCALAEGAERAAARVAITARVFESIDMIPGRIVMSRSVASLMTSTDRGRSTTAPGRREAPDSESSGLADTPGAVELGDHLLLRLATGEEGTLPSSPVAESQRAVALALLE